MIPYLIVPPSWNEGENELKLKKKKGWFFFLILSKEYEQFLLEFECVRYASSVPSWVGYY